MGAWVACGARMPVVPPEASAGDDSLTAAAWQPASPVRAASARVGTHNFTRVTSMS